MTPNPPLGVTLHSAGGLAAASFYIPYKGVKGWAWEVFWLIGGVFSWIVAPWLLALILVPQTTAILRETPATTLWWTFFFGVMWGVGGLTFGLTMRYLGIALGYAVALGCCAAFGTLIPPIWSGAIRHSIHTRGGQIQLIGIALCLVGIAISGFAGRLKERELTDDQKRATVSEFSFVKGMIVAILCGIMSASMAFAMEAAGPIKLLAVQKGVNEIWRGLPALVVILAGGFVTNFVWCVILQIKNRNVQPAAVKKTSIPLTLILCALAGTIWYFQFFFYTMGESKMGDLNFASWSLHMASIIIFSTLWGIALKEWKGTSKKTHAVIAAGLIMLMASMIVVGWGTNLQSGG